MLNASIYFILDLRHNLCYTNIYKESYSLMDEYNDDSTLDIEELLEAIHNSSDTLSEEASKLDPAQLEVREFIREYNIKPSSVYIPLELIYFHYSDWTASPLSRHKFSSILGHYFTKNKILGHVSFKLNPESIGLPSYYTIYKDPAFRKTQRKYDTAYEGVYKASGYFISRIELEDGKHYLGRFKSSREAAKAYDRTALYHFGSTTKLNFPERIKEYEKEIKEEANKEER